MWQATDVFTGRPNSNECQTSLDAFLGLAKDIGIPIKHEKTVLPTTKIEVHCIHIDTDTLMASLPLDKLVSLRTLLQQYQHRRKISLKELQSILGHLNFACKVIKPGAYTT